MSRKPALLLMFATVLTAPLFAQAQAPVSDPAMAAKGYENAGSPNAPAVNAQEAPITAGLNGQVAAQAGARETAALDARAQYEADRSAYMDALVRHDASVARSDARYIRQQRAYADAMAAWRLQVQACKNGSKRACDLPPPSVTDFY